MQIGNMIRSPKGKIVVVDGLNDYIIVDKEEVLLIYPKTKEQDIKQVLYKGKRYVRRRIRLSMREDLNQDKITPTEEPIESREEVKKDFQGLLESSKKFLKELLGYTAEYRSRSNQRSYYCRHTV